MRDTPADLRVTTRRLSLSGHRAHVHTSFAQLPRARNQILIGDQKRLSNETPSKVPLRVSFFAAGGRASGPPNRREKTVIDLHVVRPTARQRRLAGPRGAAGGGDATARSTQQRNHPQEDVTCRYWEIYSDRHYYIISSGHCLHSPRQFTECPTVGCTQDKHSLNQSCCRES